MGIVVTAFYLCTMIIGYLACMFDETSRAVSIKYINTLITQVLSQVQPSPVSIPNHYYYPSNAIS